jgi:hypothetical protein
VKFDTYQQFLFLSGGDLPAKLSPTYYDLTWSVATNVSECVRNAANFTFVAMALLQDKKLIKNVGSSSITVLNPMASGGTWSDKKSYFFLGDPELNFLQNMENTTLRDGNGFEELREYLKKIAAQL